MNDNKVLFIAHIKENVYIINFNDLAKQNVSLHLSKMQAGYGILDLVMLDGINYKIISQ